MQTSMYKVILIPIPSSVKIPKYHRIKLVKYKEYDNNNDSIYVHLPSLKIDYYICQMIQTISGGKKGYRIFVPTSVLEKDHESYEIIYKYPCKNKHKHI